MFREVATRQPGACFKALYMADAVKESGIQDTWKGRRPSCVTFNATPSIDAESTLLWTNWTVMLKAALPVQLRRYIQARVSAMGVYGLGWICVRYADRQDARRPYAYATTCSRGFAVQQPDDMPPGLTPEPGTCTDQDMRMNGACCVAGHGRRRADRHAPKKWQAPSAAQERGPQDGRVPAGRRRTDEAQ